MLKIIANPNIMTLNDQDGSDPANLTDAEKAENLMKGIEVMGKNGSASGEG